MTYYVYSASGQRVRKVTERYAAAGQTPTRREERIYIGNYEIYCEYKNDGDTRKLERESLHTMDDKNKIALVETKISDASDSTDINTPLIRYQLANHLSSSILELDVDGRVISYEEYYPFGSTSYQAVQKGS